MIRRITILLVAALLVLALAAPAFAAPLPDNCTRTRARSPVRRLRDRARTRQVLARLPARRLKATPRTRTRSRRTSRTHRLASHRIHRGSPVIHKVRGPEFHGSGPSTRLEVAEMLCAA